MSGVQLFPLYALSSQEQTEHSVLLARAQLANPDEDPYIRVQSQVFLLYRMILGQTPSEGAYEIWREFIQLPANQPMTARWYCSRLFVKTVLDIVIGKKPQAALLDGESELALKEQVLMWQPQVLNYLKLAILSEYYRYLDNQTLCVNRMNEIWSFYTRTLSSMTFSAHPYRPTEAQEDWKILQMMAFLFRAAGALEFQDYPWCVSAKLMSPITGKCPFALAMRTLNQHNPEKALWL